MDCFIAKNKETITLEKTRELAFGQLFYKISAYNSKKEQMGIITYGQCHIFLLNVPKNSQLQGIGSQLFRHALFDLAEQGCQDAKWLALGSSEKFYRRQNPPVEVNPHSLNDYRVQMCMPLHKF